MKLRYLLSFERFCFLTLLFSICLAPVAGQGEPADEPGAGLHVYLTRHAETMGNVTGDYSGKNQRLFSPKGKKQIAGIAQKFKDYHFDRILVSPTYRTQHTILPYLQEYDLVGEIWPEVEECCCDVGKNVSPAQTISTGGEVEIIEEGVGFLRLRDEQSGVRYHPANAAEGVAQLTRGVERIKKEFGQSGKSILIMCHSCTGSRLMELFLEIDTIGRFAPANAGITLLEQQPDGSFTLVTYNEKSFTQNYSWKQPDDAPLPTPGKDVILSLVPKYYAQKSSGGLRLKWRALDPAGTVRAEGNEIFASASQEKGEMLRLVIPTDGAQYGETWMLESSLFAGDTVLQSWKSGFIFPTYQRLTGTWRIKKGDNLGRVKMDYDDSTWKWTDIPGGWEKDALPQYDGIAWYRLHFKIPDQMLKRWGEKPLAIALGAIDDADETFLNGTKIGQSGEFPPAKVTAWDQQRIYEVGPTLLKENNILAIRVSDWGGGGGIWKGLIAIGPAKELRTAAKLME